MPFRHSRPLTQLNESALNAHALPLLSRRPEEDGLRTGNDDLEANRADREYELDASKHGPWDSDTEVSFDEDVSSSPVPPSTWTPPFRTRPSNSIIFAWARRLRNTFETSANGKRCWGQYRGRGPRSLRCILFLLACTLMMLGVVQFITIAVGAFVAFFPDDLDWVIDHWGDPGQPSEGLSHWPTDFTGDVRPVACHSHNDYWRKVPLYSAVHAGCISVEADIWLFDEELYVGHSTYALSPNRTLKSLYIEPLLEILEKQNPITQFHPTLDAPPNGVFDTAPSQTLILLIDFKTAGDALWPVVYSQLEALRRKNYLTYFNGTDVVEGPITVVGTGNAPFNLLMANSTYRDVFFDAPLDQMADQGGSWKSAELENEDAEVDETAVKATPQSRAISPLETITSTRSPKPLGDDAGQGYSGGAPLDPSIYSPLNSYYASVSFKKSIGHMWRSHLTPEQLELVREQIRGAHRQGLKVRYWGLPNWPRGLRNHVWHVLVREGVDVLNVDDLAGATRRDWRRRKGWWY